MPRPSAASRVRTVKASPAALRRLRGTDPVMARLVDEHATLVRLLVELGLDLVARIARAPARFFRRILGQRIAALRHETLDDAVERGAVIEALLRELLEIFDRVRRHIGPELGDHFAFAGGENRDFVLRGR